MVRGKHACRVVYGDLVRGTGGFDSGCDVGCFLVEFVSGVLLCGLS